MRRRCGVRRPISSKPGTCTERNDVYPTGISVKVSAQYPGRSLVLPARATGVERRGDGERVVERGNMWTACERVLRNKGAPGADGMRVQDAEGVAASSLAVSEGGAAGGAGW